MKLRHHVTLIAGTVIFLTLLGEGFSRYILGLGTPPLSLEHPTIEYLFKPNQDVSRFGNRILINNYGMRTKDFIAERSDPSEIRVMVFGDSILNGGSLTDHDKLATTLVSQELATAKNTVVTVGNISAGSWGPGNWLAYAVEYGFFDADVVVLILSSHDYADNPSFAPLNPATHPTRQPISALTEALSRYLPRYIDQWFLNDRREKKNENKNVLQPKNLEDATQGLTDLENFLVLAKSEAKEVIIFWHPEKREFEGGKKDDYYYKLKELIDQLGVPMVSLAEAYREATDKNVKIYRDDIHLNDAGQQVLADAILTKLLDLDL
jgi:lysophospholipase L1-like esterase